MPPRALLSDEEEREERDDRERLREIDSKLRALFDRREDLLADVRKISSEQKAVYDRRQGPQVAVEKLYDEHNRLGKTINDLRNAREAARRNVEAAIIHVREVRLTITPGERVRPESIRREIAELELRQQTHALTLDDENKLIAVLRQKSLALKDVEAKTATAQAHQKNLKEAEARIVAAREAFERSGQELAAAKAERDGKMAQVREKLQEAGGLIATLREKGRTRAELLAKVDALSREMNDLDHEARKIVAKSRTRREQARRVLREYSRTRGPPSEELLATTAEAQLEELLKRGKITLGG